MSNGDGHDYRRSSMLDTPSMEIERNPDFDTIMMHSVKISKHSFFARMIKRIMENYRDNAMEISLCPNIDSHEVSYMEMWMNRADTYIKSMAKTGDMLSDLLFKTMMDDKGDDIKDNIPVKSVVNLVRSIENDMALMLHDIDKAFSLQVLFNKDFIVKGIEVDWCPLMDLLCIDYTVATQFIGIASSVMEVVRIHNQHIINRFKTDYFTIDSLHESVSSANSVYEDILEKTNGRPVSNEMREFYVLAHDLALTVVNVDFVLQELATYHREYLNFFGIPHHAEEP